MPVDVKASYLRVYRINDGREYGSVSGSAPDPIDDDLIEKVEGIEAPVAPGETLYFDAMLSVAGEPDYNLAVVVLTPPNPNGGFTVFGRSKLGTFTGQSYGADDFNQPVGIIRAGLPGTVEGWNTVRVRGTLANGEQPGLLRFATGTAAREQGTLWATTSDLKLWKYNSTSWVEVNAAINFEIFHVNGANIIGAGGGSGGAPYSLDSGVSFSASSYVDSGSDLDIAVDDTIWLIGEDPTNFAFAILKSVNQGADYTFSYTDPTGLEALVNSTFSPNIVCHPTDANIVAAIQFNAVGSLDLIYTLNGGSSWSRTALGIDDGDLGLNWLPDGRLCVYAVESVAGDRNLHRYILSTNLSAIEESNTDLEVGAANITGWTRGMPRGNGYGFFAVTTEHNAVGGDPQEHLYRYNGSFFDEIALPIDHASPAEGVVTWAVYDSVGDILYLAGEHTGEANVRLWKLSSPMTAALADFVEMDVPSSGNIVTMAIG